MPTRRDFMQVTAAAGAATLLHANGNLDARATRGFRGTLCFFSKHLPDLDGRGLGQALKPLGFEGVDLAVRPKGHVEPDQVAQRLPEVVQAIRSEGLAVPFITTALTSAADPAARTTLETAAALKIPLFKAGYYRYSFADVRQELAAVASQLRGLAALSASAGVRLGFHNHAGYVGGGIWDIAPVIDALDPASAGYYFDVRHAVVEGGDGGWKSAFNIVAPRLTMIALKDVYWEKGPNGWRQVDCPIGQGMVPWKAYFALLAKAGFHGPVSLHLEYEIQGRRRPPGRNTRWPRRRAISAFVRAGLAEAYGPMA